MSRIALFACILGAAFAPIQAQTIDDSNSRSSGSKRMIRLTALTTRRSNKSGIFFNFSIFAASIVSLLSRAGSTGSFGTSLGTARAKLA